MEFWDRTVYGADAPSDLDGLVLLHCQNVAGMEILELGCGSGALSRELARRGATVTAVDFSESMLRYARSLTLGRGISFVQSNVLDLQLGTQFDMIVGVAILHEVPQTSFPRLVDVLDSHLATNGSMVFVENSFFNRVFRIIRTHLVDRGRLRKVGSFNETPFDRVRFEMLREHFPGTTRRVDRFVLASRALEQFLSHKPGMSWTTSAGRRIDGLFSHLPPTSRFALNWSYVQTIVVAR